MKRLLPLLLLAACSAPEVPPPVVSFASNAPSPARIVDARFPLSGPVLQGALILGTAPEGTVAVRLGNLPVRMDASRRFLIGFGRDETGPVPLDAVQADGTVLRQVLVPAPRPWKIDRLPALNSVTGEENPDFDRRREQEVAQIRAGKQVISNHEGWLETFIWPASGRVSGHYGSQRILGDVPRAPHSGVDIAAPTGTPFVAPASGKVTLARGPFAFEGNLLMVDHGNGLVSSFMHLSRFDVVEGQRVRQGEVLGAIGTTGRSTGPHLHWSMTLVQPGVRNDEVRVDPELLVPRRTPEGRTP